MTQRADASDFVQELERTESHADEVFASLAIGRRRAALRCLREGEQPVAVGELAAAVAERERRDDEPARREKWADASAALELSHLPDMDAAGLVDFDEEAGTVDVGEGTDEALALLDDLE